MTCLGQNYFDSSAQIEKRFFEVLTLMLEAHHVSHILLELANGIHILVVYLLRQNVHSVVVRAADGHGLREDLKVPHRLDKVQHVVAPLHEYIQVAETIVVALRPRAILTHHLKLVVLAGLQAVLATILLHPPQLLLAKVNPSIFFWLT